jgi:hypothetical protein
MAGINFRGVFAEGRLNHAECGKGLVKVNTAERILILERFKKFPAVQQGRFEVRQAVVIIDVIPPLIDPLDHLMIRDMPRQFTGQDMDIMPFLLQSAALLKQDPFCSTNHPDNRNIRNEQNIQDSVLFSSTANSKILFGSTFSTGISNQIRLTDHRENILRSGK